ncbi:uncharacterized protein LOC119402887 isoform X1 [Rhipicephalus sanguineus]|uniref:uncharacterized protein LOC119402887 isoform X1 n=1 Tax=Rhipicephalus sanguineus TaxID=34632 RepID=UPI0018935A15|nr:uncharacterized protein LOC119402887 isoform X1 [Rhipicephalus sanguineus]
MIFVSLVYLFPFVSADFDYRGRPDYNDWLQFYKTGMTIYLVKRSYMVKIDGYEPWCLQTKVHSLNKMVASFKQGYVTYYKDERYEVQATLQSAYIPTDVAPVMSAFVKSNRTMQRNYNFHFYDGSAHCAVLTFQDYSGTVRCELHAWKEYHYYSTYKKCEEEFDYQCPGRDSNYPYVKWCKDIN